MCWPMIPFHHQPTPMIIHTHHVAGNLPKKKKLWLLSNYQQIYMQYYN